MQIIPVVIDAPITCINHQCIASQIKFQPNASNAVPTRCIKCTIKHQYISNNDILCLESTRIHLELLEFPDSYSFIWSSSTFYRNPPGLLGICPELQESRESDWNRWGTVKHCKVHKTSAMRIRTCQAGPLPDAEVDWSNIPDEFPDFAQHVCWRW